MLDQFALFPAQPERRAADRLHLPKQVPGQVREVDPADLLIVHVLLAKRELPVYLILQDRS